MPEKKAEKPPSKIFFVDCQKALREMKNGDCSFEAFASQILSQLQTNYPFISQTSKITNFLEVYTQIIKPLFPEGNAILALEKTEAFAQNNQLPLLNQISTTAQSFQADPNKPKAGSLSFWYIQSQPNNELNNFLLESSVTANMHSHKPMNWNWRDINNALNRTLGFSLLEKTLDIEPCLQRLKKLPKHSHSCYFTHRVDL